MLSIHTNAAALSTQHFLQKNTLMLSQSMTRLGTGYRVNSAMDDAAGLQVATRLEAQSRGMQVAQKNAQNGISLLQTAEGANDEIQSMLLRMKDLATEAASDTSSLRDREALQMEFDALGRQMWSIMRDTTFGGARIFADDAGTSLGGLLGTEELQFQIGASSAEQMTISFVGKVTQVDYGPPPAGWTQALPPPTGPVFTGHGGTTGPLYGIVDVITGNAPLTVAWNDLRASSAAYRGAAQGVELLTAEQARYAIGQLEDAINCVSTFRSDLGATASRLEHTHSNLANMVQNTEVAKGRILDVDYAAEMSRMTQQKMLAQTSIALLKQSSNMGQIISTLLP